MVEYIFCSISAETSLTFDDVRIVIDSGKVKEKSFDSLSGSTALRATWVSQNSATQRKGRAGRTAPGTVFRLYSKARFENLPLNSTPEILRTPLLELCLQAKLLAEDKVSISDFISKVPEAPSPMVINSAIKMLKDIEALDSNEDVTVLGSHLLNIPMEPTFGKMILSAWCLKCLDPVVTIVSTLSYK